MNSLFKTVTDSGSQPQSSAQANGDSVVSFQVSETLEQKIFIKDLELEMSIGVLDAEREQKQRVIVEAELTVMPAQDWQQDDINDVVSYADVINDIKSLSNKNHIDLVETFAEMIIENSFKNKSVIAAMVRIEKPDIMGDGTKVGVEITRQKS